jgi:hypothetical protein
MGLDVNLSYYPDYERSKALEAAYEERTEGLYDLHVEQPVKALLDADFDLAHKVRALEAKANDYRGTTWEERDSASKKVRELTGHDKFYDAYRAAEEIIQKEMGVGKYGEDLTKKSIETTSALHPDHYFKVGYWRSSHNGSGFDHVVGDQCGWRLENIAFGPEGFVESEGYDRVLDWSAALERSGQAKAAYSAVIAEEAVSCSEHTPFYMPDRKFPRSQKEAIEIYRQTVSEQKDRKPFPGEEDSKANWFSNGSGDYYLGEPAKLVALLPGEGFMMNPQGGFKGPTMYAIFQTDKEGSQWYLDAIEIIEETIQYVLDQPEEERSKYRMYWSG